MDIDRFLFLLCSVPCGLIELLISKQKFSSSVENSASKDGGTLPSIWITIVCSQAVSGMYIRDGRGMKMIEDGLVKRFVWIPLSISLFVLGHLLRRQAIQQLGKWFTTAVRTNEQQQLITSGWYARMRHPSYTGVLMYFLGLTLLLNNWLAVLSIILPIYTVLFYRTYIEEKALEEHFGNEYRIYKRKVSNRYLPSFS